MDFLPNVTTILVANALTAMLVYSMVRMLKDEFDTLTASCFFTPVGFMTIGLLYLKFA